MTFPILDPQEIEQYLGYCAPSSIYTPEGYNGGTFGKGQHIEVSWVKNEKLQENYFFSLTSPKSVWAYDQGENEGPHDLLVGETVEGYWFVLSAGSGFYTGWEIGGSGYVTLATNFEDLYYLALDEDDRTRLSQLQPLVEKMLLEKSIAETSNQSNQKLKI